METSRSGSSERELAIPGSSRAETPGVFVGREGELARLHDATLAGLDNAVGRVVFITAAPGTGKSALVTELLSRIAVERTGVAIARGRCLPSFGAGEPYLPFIDALRDLGDETTPGAMKGPALSGLLQELAPYWLSVVPLVGSLLSATLTTTLALSGRAKVREAPSREALFVQYLELLRKLSERAPLILLLEDLHWADNASIALLAHVARGVTRHPLVIIGTMRPPEQEAAEAELNDLVLELERENIGARISLGDLGTSAIEGLLSAELGGDVSKPLLDWMQRTAGGNPLFLQELSRLLKQSGGVKESQGEWDLTPLAQSVGVPRSAEAVIEKRIQRLDPESIRMLQYASVQGNQFDSSVLAGVLELDELQLLDALEALDRRHQLVEEAGQIDLPDGDSAVAYRFRHALMQTVLYGQIAGKRRVLLHRRAGEVVERLYRLQPEKVASELAIHYHEGRVPEAAYRHARLAAQQAVAVHGHWEAERFLNIALEHAADDAKADVREALGDIYEKVGHYARAVALFTEARASAPAAACARIDRKMCMAQRKAALLPAPLLLQRVRELLSDISLESEERCRLLIEITRLPHALEAEEAAREAVAIAEYLGQPILLAEALSQLAVVWLYAGITTEALRQIDSALAVATAQGDIVVVARCHNIAGVAHARLARYRDARDRFEEMLAVYERIGDPNPIAAACTNLGALLLRLGEFDEAERILQRARLINERRDRSNLVHSLLNLAERARHAGELENAIVRYGEMAARAQECEFWSSEAVAQAGAGLCALELGNPDGARRFGTRAKAVIADRVDWFEDRDIVELLLARLEVLDGEIDSAAARLERAADALATRDVYLWARIELERARIAGNSGGSAAADIIARVISATAEVQSPPLLREIVRYRELVASH